MSLSKYESTTGTTHLARLARAILGPCMDVLREVLAKEISPPDLEKKVKTYILENKKPSISEQQKRLVYGKDYSVFDVTLLYFLLRNMCSIPPHKNTWGKKPELTDNSVSANIERIRILRNEWYGHATDFSLSKPDFERKWNHLSQIVKELEGYLGITTKYQDTLIELKTCCMDPGSIQHYIDTLRTVEGLQTDVTNLQEDVEEIKKSIKISSTKESQIEKNIFDQWQQEDSYFIPTKAFKEVEKIIKSKNLVIVAGHSGSGKSAIIQHIALKYREQGWTVKRVKKVEDIVDEYSSSRIQKDKTICVFNDPLGKESFDEILNSSWQRWEEELELYLQTAKLVMSCRNNIIYDNRLARYLVNQSHIVNIDDNKHKLSVSEKRQILTQYTSNMNLSDKECDKIVEVERYFPLLCKLYSSNEEYKIKGVQFFTEPITRLKEEIEGFRNKDRGKYCALALLVLFNDDLCVSDLFAKIDTEYKFKHTLKLCGLPENTPPSAIGDDLNALKDCFVKKVGDTHHFYHDLVMEVTTLVFGNDYPKETIMYADIGFLRRRVKLGECDEHIDPFTIHLSDRYIEQLGERLYTELFGERLLDVVLNPCLKNDKVIKVLKEKVTDHPEHLQILLKTKKLEIDKQKFLRTSNNSRFTKLSFLNLNSEVSPLFVLIAFCHTQLSQYCLTNLEEMQTDFIRCIPALYCNGSIELFFTVFKDHPEESLKKTWGKLYPIHIVSVFHNYELLGELIKIGIKVNKKTDAYGSWTPLALAAGNDTQEIGDYNHRESGAERRYKTVQLLLSNGADINLCREDGASPLYIACLKGHDRTVKLLLSNGADINLCEENGASPLYIACFNGYDSTVQLLLSNGADINLCQKNRASPLYIACLKGHDRTVKLLLSNGADINLCEENGASPLYIACFNGHDSTVQLLLSNGADINLCQKNGASPLYKACLKGHDRTVKLLLSNGADIHLCQKNGVSPLYIACGNGHDSIVKLLLSNGADINLCEENGASPLYIACGHGHDSTVKLLLSNGADINLCQKNGASPLYIACLKGHNSTVQLLLSNGADINLCEEDGASPLYIACLKGHDRTVKLLLSNGADINLCQKNGASPLYIACGNGHDSTVQLLLSNGADINLCKENGASPLLIACLDGHDSTVQLLLRNGADINLCQENRASPLYIACLKGHDRTVKLLLSNGADINLCQKNGASPLYIACGNGHDSTVQLLLSNGADINLCKENGASPLLIACLDGHESTVQLLLRNGADINLCEENRASPLYIACHNGHESTVQLLLSNGADINLCKENGASPLLIACQNGHESTVQLLLRNGADINLCEENRASPLYIACHNGHESTVQLLLSNGADINLCKENGASPLLIACQNGHESTVQLLLRNGADINLCQENRASPLYIACQNGHDSTVQLLLSKGADINLCEKNGASPLFIACQSGHESTVQLLLSNGANINLCQKKLRI
ncbi:ankyrin repeat and KH domain-containing protein mask-like [Crassostrea angulata]|uniref:ankyrin repeat and KH domain-containing protein mask-like n=1 Tax=Magallana angulata TaxID=2784310 RepID=UPI0022B17D25|nr:ankyrin repeat and KH domain-containing protein mask-like [Crassostrea angulata]